MLDWILKYRKIFIILNHGVLFVLAYVLSFVLRFDLSVPETYEQILITSLPFIILLKILIFEFFSLYQGWWRYVSVSDLTQIIKASVISALAVMAIGYLFFRDPGYPRSIPMIDFILTVGLVGGARFIVRAVREGRLYNFLHQEKDTHRVLIIGAGDAGETLAREILKHPEMKYRVVGFLDDSPFKTSIRIHGYKVLGKIKDVVAVSESYAADEIIIAIPTATGDQMKYIVSLCEETGRKIKTIPGLDRLIDGRISVSQIREVQIEDLLGRDPVELDKDAIGLYLNGKKVLVTGAAGSIGSEICRQVLAFGPHELILVDQWENGVFEMERELLRLTTRADIRFFVGDVGDKRRMSAIFGLTQPNVVFHAAAYKHVPVMEENPGEAVKNNVGGTRVLADICEETGVNRFVMVSTDKAVNPTSVMGATKRIAERYVQHLSIDGKTKFITVRFGNVLGSAGSVIPIFKEQIAKGGPVTVTHPEMVRYFMTIPEASQLVLQAGSMGRGGEIFVLDMGEPVRILDLANTLIRLSGLKPNEDVHVEFNGIRPGEKLFEELCFDDESMAKTSHAKVFVHSACAVYPDDFEDNLKRLIGMADTAEPMEIKKMIAKLVPEYTGARVVPFPSPVDILPDGTKGPKRKLQEKTKPDQDSALIHLPKPKPGK